MLITPATASEPYWAAALSFKTSMCDTALTGIMSISTALAPLLSVEPLAGTALLWRRFPLTSTRV
ncbi:hypothetical protein D3C75_1204240 [compost metagenome]